MRIVAMADHGVRSGDIMTGHFDLAVLATHGRGGLGRLLYGSIARYMLLRVGVSVLLLRPKDESMR